MTTQTYAQRTDPTPCLSPMDVRKTDMIGYIRRKYNVPDCRDIVIKQGYITKGISPDPVKSWLDSYDDQPILKRKLSGAAASAVEKMKELIDHTNEEIRALLEAREADAEMQALGNDWLRDQIIQMTDGMFVKLSDAIKALARESYEKAYARTNSELGSLQIPEPPSSAIFDKEQFKLIFAALEKAKAKMTDRIEEAFNAPADEPEDVQKIGPVTIILGTLALLLLAAALTGCEDTKKKAEQMAGDAEHLAKIEAEIAAFLANGVEKYEIVTEPGCCDDCAEKEADGPYSAADYSPGENAPPFHPNCRCGVRIYTAEEVGEDESPVMLPLDGMTLSSEGARLLAEMEVPMSSKVVHRDDDGNITEIRNQDIGDGGITVGFGTYVPYGSAGDAKRRELMEKYGIDASSTDQWVPIDVVLQLYADEQKEYVERAIERQGITEVTQQQFDAIMMQVFNSNYQAMVAAYFDDSKTDEEVVQAILDVYRTFEKWDKYGAGWENRVRAQVRVFRHGEYLKDW